MHKMEKMDWKVTTAPAIEPVTLAEAKLHLRVDADDDDALITSLIVAARIWCEGFQNRAFITQTITGYLDRFANSISLPQPPLISVESIKYFDTGGDQQTLSDSIYDVDTTSEPGLITLAFNQSWPAIRSVHHSVEIIFKAGYGDAGSDVPDTVKSAMKLLIGHLYEHRETVCDGKLEEVPMTTKFLLTLDRVVPV